MFCFLFIYRQPNEDIATEKMIREKNHLDKLIADCEDNEVGDFNISNRVKEVNINVKSYKNML